METEANRKHWGLGLQGSVWSEGGIRGTGAGAGAGDFKHREGKGREEFYMVGIQPSQPIPLKIDIEVRAILKVESDQWLFAYRDENLVIIWTLPLEKYTIRHTGICNSAPHSRRLLELRGV